MSNDKYVAMDVHKASVVIGVRDSEGKMIGRAVVETKTQTLRDYVKGLSGTVHLTFEEGTQAAWLYDLLKPLVAECIVCDPRRNKLLESGNKRATTLMWKSFQSCFIWVGCGQSITGVRGREH